MSAYDILATRGVSRLCHFTKLQSLTHILSGEDGVLASDSIRQDTKNVNDAARYDNELDYVCCSVEYPNSWFLNHAEQRDSDNLFRDWVVVYIDPEILNNRIVKFCPCNASKSNGAFVRSDIENLETIFAPSSKYRRPEQMLTCCPTDGQAEILIKGNIPRDYIVGIATGDNKMAERVRAMIKTCQIDDIIIYIAPDVLKTTWNSMIKNGCRPEEKVCVWEEE